MTFRRAAASFLSLILIGAVVLWAGPTEVLERFAGIPRWALVGIVALLALNLLVVVLRFWRVLAHFGIDISWAVAARACIAGYVVGLAMISLFGQVVGRQAALQKSGVSPIVNASIAAYERSLLAVISGGLAVFGGLYLLGQRSMAKFLGPLPMVEIVLAAIAAAILSFALGQSRFEARLSAELLTARNLCRVLEITALTAVGQILVLGCFVVGIHSISPSSDVMSVFAASAIISFAASMPISVNGWGVREVAAVYVLGTLGISAADAVTVSILVGVVATAVIYLSIPFALRSRPAGHAVVFPAIRIGTMSEIEKASAWGMGMACAVAVFFQFHAALPAGNINVNLADPFAILALAALSLHCLLLRMGPVWRFDGVTPAVATVSAMLLFGFVYGWASIGVTQWALAGRLFGWLVLLGYLSAGYLVVAYTGRHGVRRFSETIVATAVTVVVMQLVLRILNAYGLNPGVELSYNFEGYASNRNSFSFQLLGAMVLLLAYLPLYSRHRATGRSKGLIFTALLGIILAGLGWSGSRAGLIVGGLLLLGYGLWRPRQRRMVVLGLAIALVLWGGAIVSTQYVQSGITGGKGDGSDPERFATFVHAVELWQESPVFGAGLGVFIARSSEWLGHAQVIHSTPLWILAEFGLVGLAVFGGAFFAFVRGAWMGRGNLPASDALIMLLGVFAVFCLAHEIFYQRLFWLVLGALLAKPFGHREAT